MSRKNNMSLIIGLTIPVLMIVLIISTIYLPKLFAPQPRYNFLYSFYATFDEDARFEITNGRLVDHGITSTNQHSVKKGKLFVYDVSKNVAFEITYEKAKSLKLDGALISPDGYKVTYANSSHGFIFPFFFARGEDYNVLLYLVGHHTANKLKVPEASSYYYRPRFLGWIK